ncbi:MAG: S1-like domain-containing RNA-binding protein [Lachnospiraceae bacterium]|nr:S1-like domain-containing RNA-binding protein [Lachnospiraceae bacterium]
MFELGKKQTLTVVKQVDFGIYLADGEGEDADDRVLLPKKQVPEGCSVGDSLEVFLYKDSKDRIIATTNTPKLMAGEVGMLRVSQCTGIGAFLDWGLEKDILLPYKEQTGSVKEGDEVLVTIYVDKSSRLAATMKVYPNLSTDSGYRKDDMVTGIVYQIYEPAGAYVAVDNRYSALIPAREIYGSIKVGDVVNARVAEVKADGKLDLSVREKAYLQMEKDADKLICRLNELGGRLPFTDKASPELIKKEIGMSKNEFKRAVGKLLKNGKVEIKTDCIVLK